MRGYCINNVKLDLDNLIFKEWTVSNTFRFAVATGFDSDGKASGWYDNCYMTFKNGILVDCSLPR